MLKGYKEIKNVNVFDSEYLEVINMLERKELKRTIIKETIATLLICIALYVGGLAIVAHADTLPQPMSDSYCDFVAETTEAVIEHGCNNNLPVMVLDTANLDSGYWLDNRHDKYELIEHSSVVVAGYHADGSAYGYDTLQQYVNLPEWNSKTVGIGAAIDVYFIYSNEPGNDIESRFDFIYTIV